MNSSYKQLLIEVESLTQNNGTSAWRTAQIVRELSRDKDFLKCECGDRQDDLSSKLSKYSGRFALSLSDMISMIEYFPSVEKWKNGRLDLLLDDTCRAIAQQPKLAVEEGRRQKKTVPIAKYEEVCERLKQVNSIVAATSPVPSLPVVNTAPRSQIVSQIQPLVNAVPILPTPVVAAPLLPQKTTQLPSTPKASQPSVRPSGMHMVHINQLILAIESNSLDLQNEELIKRLQVLQGHLESLLVTSSR